MMMAMTKSTNRYISTQQMLWIIIFSITTIAISGIQGDIRCHCNQPLCVRTGYMCKSQGPQAGCFVEHSGYVNMDRSSDISRHGCIEMLPTDERVSCLKLAYALSNSHPSTHHHSLSHHSIYPHQQQQQQNGRRSPSFRTHNKTITCCLDDMCNYVKTIVDDNNDTPPQAPSYADHSYHHRHHNRHHQHLNNHHEQYYRPSISNNDQFDSLGRHLQESYEINNSSDGSLALIIILIIILLVILIFTIFGVVRFFRNDSHNNNQPKSFNLPQQFRKPSDHYNSNKKTKFDSLRNLMNPRRNIYSYPGHIKPNYNESKAKSHSLIMNVKVDVEGCQSNPLMAKSDDSHNNLPNIISVHNISKETFNLEKQNSIYMTPNINMHQSNSTNKSGFDLISDTVDSDNIV